MKIAVTGATGNLGHEVCRVLARRGHIALPLLRATNPQEALSRLADAFPNEGRIIRECVVMDLLDPEAQIKRLGSVQAILHLAGKTDFSSDLANARMTATVTRLAERDHVPLYHVSSGFVSDGAKPRSAYEADKAAAEMTAMNGNVPWTIFRPGISTGNSFTGRIHRFTGFYSLLKALTRFAQRTERCIRLPQFTGVANIIPVDWVAEAIVDAVESETRGVLYLTHPAPPLADWLFHHSLRILNISDRIRFVDRTVEDFRNLQLDPAERNLLTFLAPFLPYWLDSPALPNPSVDRLNSLQTDTSYLARILSYAKAQRWF